MVENVKGQTLTQFGKRIRERANALNPRALILDLRLSRGGGGHLRNGLVRELIRTEDEDTRLFVLTWRGTYSASQFILDDLDRLTEAVFIGEPAASKPTSYGDGYRVVMPNSGIQLRSSIYYWQQGQNKDPWTWVDVATPLRFADYAAGRDPAVEAALAYQEPAPLQQRLGAAAQTAGPSGAVAAARAYWADPVNRYANRARQLFLAAQGLYQARKNEEAVAVAQFAAEQAPQSADAASVLAHIAHAAGNTELARRAVKRVLELDPNDRNARTLAERLGIK
jgi:tetratricopeptide (TPR) repeat protein